VTGGKPLLHAYTQVSKSLLPLTVTGESPVIGFSQVSSPENIIPEKILYEYSSIAFKNDR